MTNYEALLALLPQGAVVVISWLGRALYFVKSPAGWWVGSAGDEYTSGDLTGLIINKANNVQIHLSNKEVNG